MKFELEAYQQDAVVDILGKLKNASENVRDGKGLETVVLSAPTGAGKTVIMAAIINTVLHGDVVAGEQPFEDRNACFLWITDDPQLNVQTYNRFADYAGGRTDHLLVVEDDLFDEEFMPSGKVCFVNTQKLGKKGNLVNDSDKRRYTFWDTMTNTVKDRDRRGSIFVVIDEAHRGMMQSRKGMRDANSIMQRFLFGYEDDEGSTLMPPTPTVIGVTATPKKFIQLLDSQTLRPSHYIHNVPPSSVRESGLLKQEIRLKHKQDIRSRHMVGSQVNEMTMLESALGCYADFCAAWQAHSENRSTPLVRPVMVVQVQDSKKGHPISATDLDTVVAKIMRSLAGNDVTDSAIAHAFHDQGKISLGGRQVRRIDPSAIDGDDHVKVVLFKTALNTGWDCPRAEVMLSFRTANDDTNIAQLVGRMVRAPLRREIEGFHGPLLNGVDLYVPHFNRDAVDKVVNRLTSQDEGENELGTPAEVYAAVDLELNSELDDNTLKSISAALASVPTYKAPKRRLGNEITQLMAIARRLQRDEVGAEPVLEGALEEARLSLATYLGEQIAEISSSHDFPGYEEDIRSQWIVTSTVSVSGEVNRVERKERVRISDSDLRASANQLGGMVGGGIIEAHIENQCVESWDTTTNNDAVVELLAAWKADPGLEARLNSKAREIIQKWDTEHKPNIDKLPREERDELQRFLRPEGDARQLIEDNPLPKRIVARRAPPDAPELAKHLYCENTRTDYAADLNGWEEFIIRRELADDSTVAWLRNNRSGGQWKLAVPYRLEGEESDRLIYPDLIVFKTDSNAPHGIAVHVIDPHSLHLSDALSKLKGMAEYAEKSANSNNSVSRVEAVAEVDGNLLRRNLADPQARLHLKACRGRAEVEGWFKEVEPSETRLSVRAEVSPARVRNDKAHFRMRDTIS